MSFKFYKQPEQMDCGPTCLRMISKFYGKNVSLEKLRELSETTREGSSIVSLAIAAEKIGLRSLGVKISFEKLKNEAPIPAIFHWKQNHFVIVHKIKDNIVFVADPAFGMLKLSVKEFISGWMGENANEQTAEGIVLFLEPTPNFNKEHLKEDGESKKGLSFIFQYLFQYKNFIVQLIIGLIAGSLLQLAVPFLTKSIVDVGIQNQNLNFVYLVLIAQLFLFAGRISIELIRGWILLHLSARINVSLVSDFFIKLMNLPIAYFDSKMTGDIMQRINDHKRIETLLTTSSLDVLFSVFNVIIFGGVLWWYSFSIFLVFIIGSALYVAWVFVFLKKRKSLDNKRFEQMSNEQSKIMELINGMQEIKLHNAEKQKRWGWEYIQAKLFKIEIQTLSFEQIQTTGADIINELKNIFITILSATLVIKGDITLGMMLAISYIIGQLNGPIRQLISFVYVVQDSIIAIERLNEIHNKANEENSEEKVTEVPKKEIDIDNISFKYKGTQKNVITNLSIKIPVNKVTAIVGASGSGKTTLLKIILKFYEPNEGAISVGETNLNQISQYAWRNYCGVVMQDGYIFNDTIANNIAIGETKVDYPKLIKSANIANINEFIEQLPLKYNSKIGPEGIGLSAGQKQRILIARAVYKDPKIIFFDEATSALDANNEKQIVQKLDVFFKERTAIIIAHRLSTIKNADQILVMNNGEIVESGTHDQLINKKGSYFNLVKNQLDLNQVN